MLHWPKKSLVMPFYYINFDQNRPPYVLIEEMFSTLTARNNILQPRALIHILDTCCLRKLRDPFLPQEQRIEVLRFCY